MEGDELTLEVFKKLHEPQLQAIGFPEPLVSVLYYKLAEKSDSAKTDLFRWFEVCPARDGVLSSTGYALRCNLHLKPVSDVFVIQHAWVSDGSTNARKQLYNDPQLLARVETVLGIEQLRDGSLGNPQEELCRTLCAQSGKSEKVARKALMDTNYDLIAALMLAEGLSNADCENKEQNEKSQSQIGFEEFKQGLVALLDPRSDITDDDLKPLYANYLKEKAAGPMEDASGIVHCGTYSWSDDDSEDGVITVSIPIPAGTNKRDIVSKLHSSHWTFGIRRSKPIIEEEFFSRVIPDECFWTLEGNTVSVSLQKLHVGERWGSLLQGEVQLSQKEVEKAKRIGEQRLTARVEAVFEKMWFVNQTYQAVTHEGGLASFFFIITVFHDPFWHVLSFQVRNGSHTYPSLSPISPRSAEACMVPHGELWACFDAQRSSQLHLPTICRFSYWESDESGVAGGGGVARRCLHKEFCPPTLLWGDS